MNWVLGILMSVVRQTTPILFVALGVLLIQTSGIMEMASEGKMLLSAFLAASVTFYTRNVWLGMLVATLATGLIGLMYIWIIQEFHVNQIIIGLSFNILCLGLTTMLNRQILTMDASVQSILPSFGTTLFGFSIPVYVGFLLVPLVWLFLRKTSLGLKIRSVGEYPRAVEAVGISVKRTRYIAGGLGSLLIGFGGAFFALGITNMFIENMVGGRGYIAMTAVTFGKYSPFGTLAAVALFGAGDALQYRVQASTNIPYQFALMVPYIMTVVALVLFARNPHQPSALAKSFYKSR